MKDDTVVKFLREATNKLYIKYMVYGNVFEEDYQEIYDEYKKICEGHLHDLKWDEKKGDPNESDLP